jgi:hypothetical protein
MSSGSQKRKLSARIPVNCTDQQKAAITAKADALHTSASALCLNAMLGVPMPKRIRPRIDNKLLTAALEMAAKIHAEAGKEASLYNQTVHALNAGRPPERMMGLLESGLSNLEIIQRDMLEIRNAVMQSLGYERNRKPPA